MEFIAVLDYEHLDNGLFLSGFAKAVAKNKCNGMVLHGDSAYTERLIQTGMMREDAVIRAAKDLNHRLVALFADHGVSTIGLNGYQRSIIQFKEGEIIIDKKIIQSLPAAPLFLLSNIAETYESNSLVPVSLPELAFNFQKEFDMEEVIIFNSDEKAKLVNSEMPEEIKWPEISKNFENKYIPDSFHQKFDLKLRLTTTGKFANYPEKDGTTLIF
ncbi:MAG: hypothetical protein ACFCU6_15325 [Balneolaceae bacterium]